MVPSAAMGDGSDGLTRRQFVEATGALSLTTGLAGCCRRESVTTVDPDIGRKNRPETIVVISRVREGQTDALHARLRGHLFEVPVSGIHFARMTILPAEATGGYDELMLSIVFDDHESVAIDFLSRNARTIDPVFSLVEGWPEGGAADRDALKDWVTALSRDVLLLYSAFSRGSDPAIRESVVLRESFLQLVRGITYEPSHAEKRYHDFLLDNRTRIDMHEEGGEQDSKPIDFVSPHEQNPFTMIYEVRPDQMKRLQATLTVGQWAIDNFHIHPLKDIPTVHYARFASMGGNKILFASCYDGEWEQYVEDFAARIPDKLDKVWGGSVGYPPGGAADAPALAKFLDDRRIERDFFYMSSGHRTVKEIQASLKLGTKLVRWSKDVSPRGEQLVESLRGFVRENQRLLA